MGFSKILKSAAGATTGGVGALGIDAVLGGDTNAGAGAFGQSTATLQDIMKRIDEIKLPTEDELIAKLEIQKILSPEQDEQIDVEKIKSILSKSSGGEQIMQDVSMGLQALADQGGLGPEQLAAFDQLNTEVARDTQAGMESIRQRMAERGTSDSGTELAMQLSGLQGQRERAQKGGMQLAAEAARAKRDVLNQQANVGSQLASQQSSRQRALADLALTGERSRAGLEVSKRAAEQGTEAERVRVAEGQSRANIGAKQARTDLEFRKATGRQQAGQAVAQNQFGQGQAQAAAAQANQAGKQALFSGILGAGAAAFASDKNLKKDIHEGKGSIRELLDKLEPYNYKYKDEKFGEGDQLGVMAQDLEKSEVGDRYVIDTPEGKMVDYEKMGPTMMASLADMHKRIKELEGTEDPEEFNDGGLKQDALASLVNKGKKYEYIQPLDARQQISDFNKTNGRSYAYGGYPLERMVAGDGQSIADIDNGGTTLELERAKQEMGQPSILDKKEESSDTGKKIGDSISKTGENMARAKLLAADRINSIAQNYSDPSDMFKGYADGGIVDERDMQYRQNLKSGLDNIKEFSPEELEEAMQIQIEALMEQVPEEQRVQLQEQLDDMMNTISELKQEEGQEYADGGLRRMSRTSDNYPSLSDEEMINLEKHNKDYYPSNEEIIKLREALTRMPKGDGDIQDLSATPDIKNLYHLAKKAAHKGTELPNLDVVTEHSDELNINKLLMGEKNPKNIEDILRLHAATQGEYNKSYSTKNPFREGQPYEQLLKSMKGGELDRLKRNREMEKEIYKEQATSDYDARDYNNGGMAYEDGGEGTIIPGENFAGDELPDRINSGEAVLNLEMQQNLLDKLKELKGKRVDEMAEDGEVEVRPDVQQKLIDISRGDADVEDINNNDNIVEARGFKRLLDMLGSK